MISETQRLESEQWQGYVSARQNRLAEAGRDYCNAFVKEHHDALIRAGIRVDTGFHNMLFNAFEAGARFAHLDYRQMNEHEQREADYRLEDCLAAEQQATIQALESDASDEEIGLPAWITREEALAEARRVLAGLRKGE